MIVSAANVITPHSHLSPGWVQIEGTVVQRVGSGRPPSDSGDIVELGEATIAPGFVDGHVHGGGGAGFDEAGAGDGRGALAAKTAVRTHLEQGTTSLVASLVTDEIGAMCDSVAALATLVEEGILAGIHLEGPWLSREHPGAHAQQHLIEPNSRDLAALLAAGRGQVRMVTLAPELPGGLDTIKALTDAGVVAAIGHTDASYDIAREALDNGATVGTHLFNAMRGLHHREPGPATALLEHPDAVIELIADGTHVHPAALRLAAVAKPHQFMLVTDAMSAACMHDGDYTLGSLDVEVRGGVARLTQGGAIAGSTLTMARAVQYAVAVAGLPLVDVVRAASTTPATALGLEKVGSLLPGYSADLVVLDQSLGVQRVMRRGEWVR
ncbi:N-acetylglucosamine-6-phosphate deacetylase [Pseudoclavibacter sp. VKM Ac-2888]|uniref:N-acetylglucosamine-6-phosphate deacetylase n=1 Tax=Pseudoclavibacter sp. VKM Ac-2888 TaxID=2783830 RepID=UPI00188B9D9F|nr:N-acetylglucosamine-6-phosphate deacetylase [Pseudoclavibacter sp. VKM Ac-2888]MBF4550937.1 N-acetylglucosamine-6-phosphate deacetylase [Pseudoclavibacter sp. VKM Ac-2888]